MFLWLACVGGCEICSFELLVFQRSSRVCGVWTCGGKGVCVCVHIHRGPAFFSDLFLLLSSIASFFLPLSPSVVVYS